MERAYPSICEILPPEVVAVEAHGDLLAAYLFPEEARLIEAAVPKRKQEFCLARSCARQALNRLGYPPAAILVGPNREPLWPHGIVGSITHCEGYSAAAVARRDRIVALGIDCEPDTKLPRGVIEIIASDDERAAFYAFGKPDMNWDKLLFSAKESLFKAWFPLTNLWLDFKDADIMIRPGSSTFSVSLRASNPHFGARELRGWQGRFLCRFGLIMTSVVACDVPTIISTS